MDTGLLLVFAVVLLISYFALRKKPNLPPSRFTIPCIGTIGIMWKIRRSRPHEVFAEESKQLGPVFSFRFWNQLLVVLNGYDFVHEALVKNAEVCSGRNNVFRKLLKMESKEEGTNYEWTNAEDRPLYDKRYTSLSSWQFFYLLQQARVRKFVLWN